MLLKIIFNPKDVVKINDNEIVLECQDTQNPMRPALLYTTPDRYEETQPIEARYVNISKRGNIKVGPKYTQLI